MLSHFRSTIFDTFYHIFGCFRSILGDFYQFYYNSLLNRNLIDPSDTYSDSFVFQREHFQLFVPRRSDSNVPSAFMTICMNVP